MHLSICSDIDIIKKAIEHPWTTPRKSFKIRVASYHILGNSSIRLIIKKWILFYNDNRYEYNSLINVVMEYVHLFVLMIISVYMLIYMILDNKKKHFQLEWKLRRKVP